LSLCALGTQPPAAPKIFEEKIGRVVVPLVSLVDPLEVGLLPDPWAKKKRSGYNNNNSGSSGEGGGGSGGSGSGSGGGGSGGSGGGGRSADQGNTRWFKVLPPPLANSDAYMTKVV
jgi:uncharacterized membrane protein YgcG